MRRVDPARVALLLVALVLVALVALLLDVYIGRDDPVHVAMVAAFGPLAFLVPVGAGLLALDLYRRHEGRRAWLRFEESCGAVLLFISALTLASATKLTSSLVGDSLREEITGVAGSVGALLIAVALLVVGLVLAFHVTVAQVRSGCGKAARVAGAGWREAESLARRRRARRAAASDAPAAAGVTPLQASRSEKRAGRGEWGWGAAASSRPDETDTEEMPAVVVDPPAPLPFTARVKAARKGTPSAPIVYVADDPPPLVLPSDDGRDEEPIPELLSPLWPTPAITLFDAAPPTTKTPTNNDARARIIEETLASFNVAVEVVDVQSGPTVTQFGLRPAPGVRVQRITALQNDLALALAAPSIRIEAPVPGKPMVGIEIPNGTTTLVTLREILESDAYARARSPLTIALGQNVAGEAVAADLARMPHLLIAGATGSGKSVCLNSLIACLLYRNSPERLRLLMIDPKMVELTTFNGVPHLLHPVVTEMDKVSGTLKWALKEMHRRYKLFGEAGARNIARYNELQHEKLTRGEPATGKNQPLPYIVFIIDELADLMMVSPAEVEDSISRLAALARATGIHLVLATQRPSVDVITGVIKANFPARIAFAVSSQVDSRTILDQAGAEKLLGRGDMLYLPSDGSKAIRVQGAFLSDEEIERLVVYWKDNAPLTPEQIATSDLEAPRDEEGEGDGDKLLADATKVVREYRRASVSLLQRRLSIGYSRAARLLDQLEDRGVVGPSEDGRSRVVLDAGGNELTAVAPSSEDETRGTEE